MTKQELAHIARLMYDLQEYCKFINRCQRCSIRNDWGFCLIEASHIPQFWGITKADIERLERESDE